MCQFNNIILPANTNLDEVRSLFRQNKFNASQVYNSSLSQQLPDKIFLMSPKNQCDCGSVISSARHQTTSTFPTDKEVERLKLKGWSETKIKNHFANKQKANSHKTDEIETERANWSNLIKSIFASTKLNSFGILAHEYVGDISTEAITVKAKTKIKTAEFVPQQLENLLLDVYYEIQS